MQILNSAVLGDLRVVVMREIRARHDERAPAAQNRRQRVAERARGVGVLIAHDERHDRRAGREMSEERQLHLEGMLAHVRRGVLLHRRRRLEQRARARLVNRRDAQRRLESARRIDGHALEADEVRRSDENRDVELPSAQQAVGVRRDRSRVHQPRVRRDQRDQIAGHVARRVREVTIDRRCKLLRRTRIPASSNRRPADVPRHG